ncbi:hypothetical protein ACSQ6I_28250 [Anabaena sp. WFMT]
MNENELDAIPKEHFRFILKGKRVVMVFTDDGVKGGSFWDITYIIRGR